MISVLEPGPYGISDLGVWVSLLGEKMDDTSSTKVRITNLSIFNSDDVIRLVRHYGKKFPHPTAGDEPKYAVFDHKDEFKQSLYKLILDKHLLDEQAQEIDRDLAGVSF